MSPRRFKSQGEGLLVTLTAPEVDLLRSIPDELRPVLGAGRDPDDPVRERLFPRAYLDPTEDLAEQEWQDLVHPELIRERLAALERLVATLDRATERKGRFEVEIDADEAQAWLGALNDARLALGTRLGVTEDLDATAVDADHPDAAAFAVYGWLTWVQGDLVETLLG
ncbi:MAG TPA: DUF2017 family protein [Acidimicrobiia bacterium]